MKFEERAFCPVARCDTRLQMTNDRYSFLFFFFCRKERNSSNGFASVPRFYRRILNLPRYIYTCRAHWNRCEMASFFCKYLQLYISVISRFFIFISVSRQYYPETMYTMIYYIKSDRNNCQTFNVHSQINIFLPRVFREYSCFKR